MSPTIKDILEDAKTYVVLAVGLCGVLNNYLHIFMPLAPSLRLRTNVILIVLAVIAVGITVAKVHEKKGPGLNGWAAWVAGLGAPVVTFLESHSYSQSASQWFDAIQTGAYVLPFVCWSIAVTALLSLFF
jgi:hypothetical protein